MSTRKHSFLISGGGTGGHIFPALAIGAELKREYPDALIEFVGASDRMEMQKVPEAGFNIHGLWISGIQRKQLWKNVSFPFKLISSLTKSYRIIRRNRPDVVIGVGGFASGPLLYVANLLGIPTVLQEQNSYPGITNKLLASRADRICVAFEKMDRFFPKEKIVLTGNPIRQDILLNSKTIQESRTLMGLDPDRPCILIIGGSLGARTINEAIAGGLDKFRESGIQLLWQTGKSYSAQHDVLGKQTQFITEMDLAYRCADLVISRAGASSLSEICALGKAAILVPSPNVAEDHQTRNAEALVQKDAALLVKDSEARQTLVDEALTLLADPGKIQSMSVNAQSMALPGATAHIVEEIRHFL
ncbi:MAG: undecaprenyldiphospho-muramoylpentapeptide beta-N-acetylglucosaminyltransferase [Bacteroidetes bacterium]|nr:undecaprenyldiphospho-muramoylpentapeptide beta-N-acetylglucosaminyltransferase [Bacteroidota bacterium]